MQYEEFVWQSYFQNTETNFAPNFNINIFK